jgi:hypothetical protein
MDFTTAAGAESGCGHARNGAFLKYMSKNYNTIQSFVSLKIILTSCPDLCPDLNPGSGSGLEGPNRQLCLCVNKARPLCDLIKLNTILAQEYVAGKASTGTHVNSDLLNTGRFYMALYPLLGS